MAQIPKFKPHEPAADAVDLKLVQEAVRRVLDDITRRPQLSAESLISGSQEIEHDLITAQENLIEHKLGRPIRGWRVTDIQADATVWRTTSPTTTGFNSSRHLCLECSANVTVKLEVWP